jgi:hypothetical protein
VQLLVLAAIIGVPVPALAYGFKLVDGSVGVLHQPSKHLLRYGSRPLPVVASSRPAIQSSWHGEPRRGRVPRRRCPSMPASVRQPDELRVATRSAHPHGSSVRRSPRRARMPPAHHHTAAGSFAITEVRAVAERVPDAGGGGHRGPMLGLVLLPGLLAAGIGELVFVGLDSLTGFGTFSLAIPNLPAFGQPTGAMFLWAIVFGVVAAFLGRGIQWLARAVRPHVEPRMVLLMPVLGALIAGLAIGFGEATGKSSSEVLFSGQSALPGLVGQSAEWSVGALLLLVL